MLLSQCDKEDQKIMLHIVVNHVMLVHFAGISLPTKLLFMILPVRYHIVFFVQWVMLLLLLPSCYVVLLFF